MMVIASKQLINFYIFLQMGEIKNRTKAIVLVCPPLQAQKASLLVKRLEGRQGIPREQRVSYRAVAINEVDGDGLPALDCTDELVWDETVFMVMRPETWEIGQTEIREKFARCLVLNHTDWDLFPDSVEGYDSPYGQIFLKAVVERLDGWLRACSDGEVVLSQDLGREEIINFGM